MVEERILLSVDQAGAVRAGVRDVLELLDGLETDVHGAEEMLCDVSMEQVTEQLTEVIARLRAMRLRIMVSWAVRDFLLLTEGE